MRAAARLPLRSQIPVAALLIAAALALLVGRTAPPVAAPAVDQQSSAQSAYGKLPLSFVPNRGQLDSRVRFYAQTPGLGVFFGDDKVTLALQKRFKGHALELRFIGANAGVHPEALDRRAGKVNYLTGPDRSRQTGIPTFGAVRYRDVWPGIDLTFKGTSGALKYEFVVRPGADPTNIRLAYAGASGLSILESGDLNVATPLGALVDTEPTSFQRKGGGSRRIQSEYVLHDRRAYGFSVGRYDQSRTLVIDPGLAYSTLLGASASHDNPAAVAVDRQGSAYLTGTTSSAAFPTTPGAYDVTFQGGGFTGSDAFVTKLRPDGSDLVYSTFLGGGSDDIPHQIAVDNAGHVFVIGDTSSNDFPTTVGAFDTALSSTDGFVTKLTSSGDGLEYSTFLGGNSSGSDIDVDPAGNAYVVTFTAAADFPITPGAYDTSFNGFADVAVTKLNPAGSALVYSTFLGGPGFERGEGVAIDGQGNAYVSGDAAQDFPTTPGAFDTTYAGQDRDAFAAKLNADGSNLLYSTYLGSGGSENARDVAVNRFGEAYVVGNADSVSFPNTPGAYDPTFNGAVDGFVTKLNASGSALVFSTFLGGSFYDSVAGIALDSNADAYVTGETASGFPTTSGAFDTSYSGNTDGFLTKLSATGSTLLYSSYLGGALRETGTDVAVDPRADAYVAGATQSVDFPTTPGAFDQTHGTTGGEYDGFATKFDLPNLFDAPLGASPLHFSLVPELRQTISASQCQARGGAPSTHGAPLVLGSCNPPTFVPGTQARFRGAGSADLTAVTGDLSTPADEADLAIAAALSDVPAAAGGDYNPSAGGPDLTLVARLRISDTNNGASASDPATVADLEYSTPVDCTPTIDPGVGSDCAVATSADSLTPGAILEGRNTVIQSFRVRVHDSGPNAVRGDGDDRRLASQGIYIP